MGYLLLVISIWYFIKNKKDKLFTILIFSIFAFPNNAYIKSKLLFNILTVDISYVVIAMILVLWVLSLLKTKIVQLYPKDILFLFFTVAIIIYFFIGKYNGTQFLIEDFKIYLTLLLLYLVIKICVKSQKDFIYTLNTLCIMSLIYSISIIIIYFFFKDSLGLFYGERLSAWWENTNRISFGNTSFLLITSSMIYYKLISKDYGKKIISFFLLVMNIVAILLSQNRTLIVLTVTSLVLIQCYVLFKTIHSKKLGKKGVLLNSFIYLFLFSCLAISMQGKVDISNNFILDLQNRFSTNLDSLDVRSNGNRVAWDRIMNNKLGEGIGAQVTAYSANWKYSYEGNFIDNIYMTIGVKFGLFGLTILIIMILKSILNLINDYKKTRNSLFIVLVISYLLSLILTTYMNAQIVYTVSLSFIFLLFLNLEDQDIE
ncbi:hypothetical protein CKN73_02535 [Carnobacterium divergens]|uniref:O-antigen ligase family protein n=1 Tax=Carnobacterium divergens TaxID=2748 RepID=UPI001072A6B9|nr:hypothetical protein [Carnobacterium divergens]TFJ44432.1 hypothetical protein CKN77_02510 [Carnobacterium divergens]TFJ52405.1 hypothetical protein CKN73_02535 [Carnobacterium divergens]TFJ57570.1 hypothetical protein CKN83_02525 [Carnobacterium divergens]TFJ65996.1 hypothetical protein CKN89_02535 [Carnobacterium divergens]TFJ74301.1 hypothetical protein CKN91_02530 [Carnobacterium divergens]